MGPCSKVRGALTVLAVALVFGGGLRAHDGSVEVYSAASLDKDAPVTPNSIAIIEGEFGERTTIAPNGEPQLELDSVTVVVEGSDEVEISVKLFSVAAARAARSCAARASGRRSSHREAWRGGVGRRRVPSASGQSGTVLSGRHWRGFSQMDKP